MTNARRRDVDKVYHRVTNECRKWVMVNHPDVYEEMFTRVYKEKGLVRNKAGRPPGISNRRK